MTSDPLGAIPSTWRAPTAPESRNYPYNCWWVAGFSTEIRRELLGRWLLDTPVLLYRTEDGRVVALENRCPHRAAPLSLGMLKGDNVQCGYHGFTFGADGAGVRVPSMKSPPAAVRVRTSPVIEQSPLVWVYLGDPARDEAMLSTPSSTDVRTGAPSRTQRTSSRNWNT